MSMKVGIIGAGPSGLSQLRAFERAQNKGLEIPEKFVLKNNLIGVVCGIIIGVLELMTGDPCHGSMYRYLWSNGPKKVLNLQTTPLRSILERILPHIHQEQYCLIYQR